MTDVWLGRWRIAGTNWEGRDWVLCKGGVQLARQVNALWPTRHAADGTVASKGHDANNPNSDHRPYPYHTSPATVRALDVGEVTEDDGITFAELLRASRDPRIKYVLHENRIFSSYPRLGREPWEWAPLSIGHPSHVHVSFTELADTDDTIWNLGGDLAHLSEEAQQFFQDTYDRLKELEPATAPSWAYYLVNHVRKHPGGLSEADVRTIINSGEWVWRD